MECAHSSMLQSLLDSGRNDCPAESESLKIISTLFFILKMWQKNENSFPNSNSIMRKKMFESGINDIWIFPHQNRKISNDSPSYNHYINGFEYLWRNPELNLQMSKAEELLEHATANGEPT